MAYCHHDQQSWVINGALQENRLYHSDELMQEIRKYRALAMELRISCTISSIYRVNLSEEFYPWAQFHPLDLRQFNFKYVDEDALSIHTSKLRPPGCNVTTTIYAIDYNHGVPIWIKVQQFSYLNIYLKRQNGFEDITCKMVALWIKPNALNAASFGTISRSP